MELRKSERKIAKIKLAIQGPSGSGKTYSSLLIAKGLCNGNFDKVAVIDTENGSANLYSHLGNFNVLSISSPFTPEKYIQAISICEEKGMEVIILDSISQCWENLLHFHSNMQGNSFANWSKVTPRQNDFIQKILSSKTHIISTMRTKQDYVLNNKNGKYIPEKVGLKAIQRDGIDYEFTIVFNIDIHHNVIASKDRTNLFSKQPMFIISENTGMAILNWCNKPNEMNKVVNQIKGCLSIEELNRLYKTIQPKSKVLIEVFNDRKRELTRLINN